MVQGENDIVSDISSNTVTLAVASGKVIGAIDACIFAPGVHHGPLDLQAIRNVDDGFQTANQAFIEAGVLKMTPYKDREELIEKLSFLISNYSQFLKKRDELSEYMGKFAWENLIEWYDSELDIISR